MRKLQRILLIVALLGVVAVKAHAVALETGGEIRVRGWSLDNYAKNGATTEFWDQRLPLGPLVTVGLEGAYSRGDDPKTPGKNEGFFSADYQGPYWSVIFYNNMDCSGYAGDTQSSNADMDSGVRNAVTGKFSAVVTPLKNLSVTGAGLYAAADRTRGGVDKALGWEFDVIAVYGITGNVSLTAGGSGRKPDNPLGGVVAFTTRF